MQLIFAFLGALGFSLIYNVNNKHLFFSAVGGVMSWGVYLVFDAIGAGIFISSVISAAVTKIYSELLARCLKAPTTVFYIPAVIPLVPGGSLYYTMSYAASRDWSNFMSYGWKTLQVALGIAVGISFVTAALYYVKYVATKGRYLK